MTKPLDETLLKTIRRPAGLVGFKCPHLKRDVEFDFCWRKCDNPCKPPPALFAIAGSREVEENVYHVTEILNPPRVVYYTRNYPYFDNIDNLIVMKFGTAIHQILENTKKYVEELGIKDDYLTEQSFRINFGGGKGMLGVNDIILSGTSDLYVKSTKTLWDFKTMKFFYTMKYLIERQNWDDGKYHWQLNIYRVYQYPEAQQLKIFAFVKDWNRSVRKKHNVDPTETLQVPMIDDDMVRDGVVKMLTNHVECQKDPTKIRDCTEKEMWGGIRCKEYCAIADQCPQFKKYKEEK